MAFDINQWLQNNTTDLHGRVVVMTGAAGGLGSVVTRHLLKAHAKVIMLERDVEKMENLRKQLLEEMPTAEIEIMQVDLNQIKSINQVITQLVTQRIDYLILNAGVYNVPITTSELGYNNVFQINFVGQYYLTKQLLPALQRTKGKVVLVSSIAASYYGKLDENDIDYTKHEKKSKIYGNSKRFIMFALAELFKERDDVSLSIVHPGITLTPMTNARHNEFIKFLMKLFFPKAEVAALNIVRGVFEDLNNDEWIGPRFLRVWGVPTISKLPESTAVERAKIFNLAENICKLITSSKNFN